MLSNTKKLLILLTTITLNTTCLTAMTVTPTDIVATEDTHKSSATQVTNTAIIPMPGEIKIAAPPKRQQMRTKSNQQQALCIKVEVLPPTNLSQKKLAKLMSQWINNKDLEKAQSLEPFLYIILEDLPKELIAMIASYDETTANINKMLKPYGLHATQVRAIPRPGNLKQALGFCLCTPCKLIDQLFNTNAKIAKNRLKNNQPINFPVELCVTCCMPLCGLPCRLCASFGEGAEVYERPVSASERIASDCCCSCNEDDSDDEQPD